MKSELVMLQDSTLSLLKTIFESPTAAAALQQDDGALAGKGFTAWQVYRRHQPLDPWSLGFASQHPAMLQVNHDAEVADDGTCEAAGGVLKIVDLTPEEM